MKKTNFSVLFDLDGVVADTMGYHAKAWKAFGKNHGFKITDRLLYHYFTGRVNDEILEYLFKRKLSKAELKKFIAEKENFYRKLYRPHIKPVKGLLKFLSDLKKANIKIALGTAAPKENVKFILTGTKAKKYFKHIITAEHVKLGKPNPDIYLKAAKIIKAKAKDCIVFEDAMNGIEAGRRAHMKVIAVATTHKAHELKHADMVIKDFTKISLDKLQKLIS